MQRLPSLAPAFPLATDRRYSTDGEFFFHERARYAFRACCCPDDWNAMPLAPRDWLLVLLALRDASTPLDPVRLQKGMFLLAREGGISSAEAYSFRPYDYGPFASALYRDLESLAGTGLVESDHAPGYNWHRYRATPAGIEHARRLTDALTPEERPHLDYLYATKQEVLTRSFRDLLHHVYSRYPEFRERSVFSG